MSRRWISLGILALLLILSVLWVSVVVRMHWKWLTIPVIGVAMVSSILFLAGKCSAIGPVLVWLLLFALVLLPFDITLRDMPGPPRFIDLVRGYPGRDDIDAAARGEILLAGCEITGFEPLWVWVW
jgi:hypothetical protein